MTTYIRPPKTSSDGIDQLKKVITNLNTRAKEKRDQANKSLGPAKIYHISEAEDFETMANRIRHVIEWMKDCSSFG